MFEVIGSDLKQWDIGRKVQLIGAKADQFHFENHSTKNALVIIPTEQDGALVGEVPNILLQSCQRIIVHAVEVGEDYERTLFSQVLSVMPRQKPDDYVYTESEVASYTALEKRLAKIEKNGIPSPQTAKVGQVISVKAVDENGKPTEWECVDREEYDLVITIAYAGDSLSAVSVDAGTVIESGDIGIIRSKAQAGEFARILLRYICTYDGTICGSSSQTLASYHISSNNYVLISGVLIVYSHVYAVSFRVYDDNSISGSIVIEPATIKS